MSSGPILSKVLSDPRLLREGGATAFRLLLEYSPTPVDYDRDEDVQTFYRNLFELAANFLYADFRALLEEHIMSQGGERLYNRLEAELYHPVTNENLRDPERLLECCRLPMENLLVLVYKTTPLVFYCLLTHYMSFQGDRLASKYKITEYNLACDTEFIDVCALLLIGWCVYNTPERSWYKYNGRIWEKAEGKSVAVFLLKKFYAFVCDLTLVLSEDLLSLESDDEKKTLETKIGRYKSFWVKKGFGKIKSILEPLEDILRSGEDIHKFNKKDYHLFAFNGVVDLTTGERRDFRPLDYATFRTPVAYIPRGEIERDVRREEAEALFQYFIDCFTSEDGENKEFVQVYFGYGITGKICEQTFLIIRGKGSNSKSIFLSLFTNTLGEYFTNLPRCVIIDGGKVAGQATPQFEKLATARLGAVAELKSKDKFDLENIKNITGGDSLPSRSLYKGYESIQTQTKIFTITNEIAKALFSYAYARRVIIFPSQAKFIKGLREEDRRPGVYPVIFDLGNKMKDRRVCEAFLRFLVEGAVKFFRLRSSPGYSGIPQPENVRRATESYLASIDDIGRFILDITGSLPQTFTFEVLFENFRDWYLKYKGRESFKNLSTFREELGEMGITPTNEEVVIIPGDANRHRPRYPITSNLE